MAKQFDYEVKTTIRLNMHNPDHVLINNVIQNLDPKIFKSKNQFILDACKFYIDNYGSETFIAKKKDNERAEYIRSADIEDIKAEVIEAAINEDSTCYFFHYYTVCNNFHCTNDFTIYYAWQYCNRPFCLVCSWQEVGT